MQQKNGGDLMDNLKLKGKIVEKGLSQTVLAEKMGLSIQSFNGKLNGRYSFTIPEAMLLIELLSLENPAEIFFNQNISNMQQNENE